VDQTARADAGFLTGLIEDRPMCLDCITLESGMSLVAVETSLTRLPEFLELHAGAARCRHCEAIAKTFSVERVEHYRRR
jgi:hypothetical protein